MNTFNSYRSLYTLSIAFSISLFLISFSSCSDPVAGCMDPTSSSFDPTAEEDDGSCTYTRDLYIGEYRFTSANETVPNVLGETAILKIEPRVNTTTGVNVIAIFEWRGAFQNLVSEGEVREGQIDINYSEHRDALDTCSPALRPGTLQTILTLKFSSDNNTANAKGTFKATYDDGTSCTVSQDNVYTRS